MTVQITIKGDNLNYSGETSLLKAGQILAFLGSEQSASSYAPEPRVGSLTMGSPSASPRQLIVESNAKSNPQKIAVIGKYLKDRGQNEFSRAEVLDQFRRAGESTPKNIGRDLQDAVRSGYICESDTQKNEYYLTRPGEEALESRFVH